MSTSVVVVKIGGSLFLQPNFVPRLKIKIADLSKASFPAHLVLITGGGPLVNALRNIDSINQISEGIAHRTAIHMMDVNSHLLCDWWPELQCTDSMQALQARLSEPGITVFRVESYLSEWEPFADGTRLSVGWDVTSDSIAARCAEILKAKKLVLLKSAQGRPGATWSELAADGLIDPAFSRFVARLGEVSLEALLIAT